MKEELLFFSKATMARDNKRQLSPYKYVAILRTEAFHYSNLFIHCMSLLEKISKEYPGFKTFFGVRIKIFDGISFVRKDWNWYGRRSYSLESANNYDFKLSPFENFSVETIKSLWEIKNDNWEIVFYIHDTVPLESRLAKLAFYRFGEGIEISSVHELFSEFLHKKMFMDYSLSRRIAVEYGAYAMQKLHWEINRNIILR